MTDFDIVGTLKDLNMHLDKIHNRICSLEEKNFDSRLSVLENHYQETMSLIGNPLINKSHMDAMQRLVLFVHRMLGQAEAMKDSGSSMDAKAVEEMLVTILDLAEEKQ